MPKGKGKFQKGNTINLGRKPSKETKQKISNAMKGRKKPPFSVQWKRNISLARKGKKASDKAKKNMSIAHWKGGTTTKGGYICILTHEHPSVYADGYILRSHLVMEKMLGRYLARIEVVHHKGVNYPLGSIENKQDDSPENLQLFPNRGSHTSFHHTIGSFCIKHSSNAYKVMRSNLLHRSNCRA